MRIFLTLAGAMLLAVPAFGGQQPSHGGGMGPGGPNAPGDEVKIIFGPGGDYRDLAHDGQYLLAYATGSSIQIIHDGNGASMGTIALPSGDYYGLTWDDKRERIVTTDSTSGIVSVFTRGGVLTASWSVPGTGLRGAAWDRGRDLYWVIDATANTVFAVDPTTGAAGTMFSTAAIGCTRGVGLCHDPNTDILYVTGRDQDAIFGMNAATGALVCSFPVHAQGGQGLAISPRGGIWEYRLLGDALREHEGCSPIYPELRINPNFPSAGGPVTLTMRGLAAGERAVILHSRTGGGPTSSPIGELLLSHPRIVLAVIPAGGAGAVTLSGTLPIGTAGMTIYFHGGGLGGSGRCNPLIIRP